MAIYLGIDGGGTKTACAVGDEARVLGTATTGASNVVRVGEAEARNALETAIAQACAAAGVSPAEIAFTCVGLAGFSVAAARDSVRQSVSACVGGAVEVVGDMEVAFEAAFGGGSGAIAIAGTGSIVYARDDRGYTARAGGWGHTISDEGSADWIGKRAIASIMRARDRGCASGLETLILQQWGVSTSDVLAKIANCAPEPDFAQLFPAVLAAADSGDELACAVLKDAGAELAELTASTIRALWRGGQWVRVALAGGVFRHSAFVRQQFYGALRGKRQNVAVSFAIVEPVAGALSRARKGAG
jgi:N-acetylglucosamine kinase-like BadF-type ATPase